MLKQERWRSRIALGQSWRQECVSLPNPSLRGNRFFTYKSKRLEGLTQLVDTPHVLKYVPAGGVVFSGLTHPSRASTHNASLARPLARGTRSGALFSGGLPHVL